MDNAYEYKVTSATEVLCFHYLHRLWYMFYDTFSILFFAPVAGVTFDFWHTMGSGDFVSYHRLWHGCALSRHTDVIHTPWATSDALGLDETHQGDE